MTFVDIAQIITAIGTVLAVVYVAQQNTQQSRQLQSDRLLSLYQDLDNPEAWADRKFLYKKFEKLKHPAPAEILRARRQLAALDRMSYQVRRGFLDRRSVYDLYGLVLVGVILSTWSWLLKDRKTRRDPADRGYCGNAEWLALGFAEERLRECKLWERSFRELAPTELLRRAWEAGRRSRS